MITSHGTSSELANISGRNMMLNKLSSPFYLTALPAFALQFGVLVAVLPHLLKRNLRDSHEPAQRGKA